MGHRTFLARVCLVAVTVQLAVACGGKAVIDGDAGSGGASGSTISSVAISSTGNSTTAVSVGTGGNPPWENSCSDSGIEMNPGSITDPPLTEACPDDFWSAQHYDGATAYDEVAGFVGLLNFRACDSATGRTIFLSAYLDESDDVVLLDGLLHFSPDEDYTLAAGTLYVDQDGDVGEMVIGSFQGTFNPVQNDGPAIPVSGSVRACHLPPLALP